MTDPNTPVTALRPCPFCGGDAVLDGKSESCRVRCLKCCAEGAMSFLAGEEQEQIDACEADATSKWNARPAPVGGVEGAEGIPGHWPSLEDDLVMASEQYDNTVDYWARYQRMARRLEVAAAALSRLSPEPVGAPHWTDSIQLIQREFGLGCAQASKIFAALRAALTKKDPPNAL